MPRSSRNCPGGLVCHVCNRAAGRLVREHIRQSRPFGTAGWTEATAIRLGLESTLRGRGRPKKRKGSAG